MMESLMETLEQYSSKGIHEYDPDLLYSTFKSFRDLGMKNQQFQNEPIIKENALKYITQILNNLFTNFCEQYLPPIGQGLQFIHNLTVQNQVNQSKVWEVCKGYFKMWMMLTNEKIRNYICGTLYNICLGNADVLYFILEDTILVNYILDSALKGTDFSILLTESIKELLTDNANLFLDKYLKSNSPYHLEMLNALYECVQSKDVNEKLVNWIKENYKDKTKTLIFKAETKPNDFEEVYYFLKILVVFSGKDKINKALQEDIDILIYTKLTLEKIHNEGRNSINEFTPTENIMTERTSVENLKTNLIRLIGNLCWRNKILQDKIRELEGIPLIMDCCIRDGKNPFITETVIFAIRNLCEGNFENQNFIKNMNKVTHDEMSQRTQNWPSVFIPNI